MDAAPGPGCALGDPWLRERPSRAAQRAGSRSTRPGRVGKSRTGETDLGGDAGERGDDERDVLVEIDTELGGLAVDVVAVDGACERLVLELLPDRGRLEPGDDAAGANERHRVDEAR